MPGPKKCHPHCKPGQHRFSSEQARAANASIKARHKLTAEERRRGGANNDKRHVFTREECQEGGRLGFERMQLTLLEKHPDWFCALHGGQHISGCFLKHRNPLFFAARKLEEKVRKFKPRGPEDAAKLAELQQGVVALVQRARSTTQRAGRGR
jgi:hypothetical protein